MHCCVRFRCLLFSCRSRQVNSQVLVQNYEQMWDSDFDRKVKRTALRPLASGALSRSQALTFLGLQLSAGFGILITLNEASVLLGASSLALVFTYPLFKRGRYSSHAGCLASSSSSPSLSRGLCLCLSHSHVLGLGCQNQPA